jgi:glutamate synthase (NADPH) small chain
MGDAKGFLSYPREGHRKRPVELRVLTWREFERPPADSVLREQGARCMDCGVPFCQADTGCPVQNVIPEWNDLVRRDRWREALASLEATNNFPEFTGRICPAPCETACVLGLIDEPVSIRSIEQAIADRGWAEGWIRPRPPERETGRRVAVVGSGPAGLAAAQQLRRLGHEVVVFEKADRPGGLLRYGVPEFKLEGRHVERRLDQLRAEGVAFVTGVTIGEDIPAERLRAEFDAVLLAVGAEQPRDETLPGRELQGVHQAMDYLIQQNRVCEGDAVPDAERIDAKGKRVIVIGGGDTGSDCVGTAARQGAAEIYQFARMAEPPAERAAETPWPYWPMQLTTSHAHEEGCRREWGVATTEILGDEHGRVRGVRVIRVERETCADAGRRYRPVPDSEYTLDAEMVLLAIGFRGPAPSPLLAQLGVELDARGNLRIDAEHRTSAEGVFAAGDASRGASLIVWAIREGRDAAAAIDRDLARVGDRRRTVS